MRGRDVPPKVTTAWPGEPHYEEVFRRVARTATLSKSRIATGVAQEATGKYQVFVSLYGDDVTAICCHTLEADANACADRLRDEIKGGVLQRGQDAVNALLGGFADGSEGEPTPLSDGMVRLICEMIRGEGQQQ